MAAKAPKTDFKEVILRLSRNIVVGSIRTLLGTALGLFLIHLALTYTHTDLFDSLRRLGSSQLIIAILLHGCALLLLTIRWHLLLIGQGILLPFPVVLRLTMIGAFFNLIIPGPVSGDIAKGVFVTHLGTERKTEAAVSILLDRLVGISVLGILSITAFGFWILRPTPGGDITSEPIARSLISDSTIGILALAVTIAGLVVALVLLTRGRVFSTISRCLPARFTSIIRRTLNAVEVFRKAKSTIVWTGLVTLCAQVLFVCVLYVVATGVSSTPVPPGDCFIAFQVGAVLSTIPLTPGGIGVRDIGLALALESLVPGITGSAAIAILLSAVIVFWRLVGGLFFLWTIIVPRRKMIQSNEE